MAQLLRQWTSTQKAWVQLPLVAIGEEQPAKLLCVSQKKSYHGRLIRALEPGLHTS